MMDDGKPAHPIKASALKPVVEAYLDEGKPFNMGMVFPVSTHNYELRYWLAAGGIHPGYYSPDKHHGPDRRRSAAFVTPAAADARHAGGRHDLRLLRGRTLEPAGGVQGHRRAGHHRLRALERTTPRKSSASPASLPRKYPNTTVRIVKALIRAAIWLDENDNANRPEAVEILSRPNMSARITT